MRLDKYLKVSRIIKRRSVAKELIDKGNVFVNDKKAKSSTSIKVNDVIFIESKGKYRVILLSEYATEEKAKLMFEKVI